MSIEDLLRETLSDMAREESPPPPGRFLQVDARRSHRRGLTLAAAAAVTVMAVGSTLVVGGLSSQVAAPKNPTGQGSVETLPDPNKRLREKITINEGLRLSDTLVQLSKKTGKPLREFQQVARSGKGLGLPSYAKGKLEGYAFPATYEITPEMGPAEILSAMVDRFNQTADKEDLQGKAEALGRTSHEIMTIASIVQAESGSKQDMGKVARVIYNRLDLKPERKLEMDSTVMYGLNKYGLNASNKDLRSTSPYNTYMRPGLPPGPIGNPGADAIKAALKPADGSWLWFVTTDPKKGVTKFASSESEFLKLKDEWERNRRTG
ncbi:endolytic transglycosylase MltG [Streptosporangium sp. 'caverna']|uniref:endolytic transglycosylase MltG n=1 Tax=Streptosporangium sp. 'caverna' TaxID=2202249 RepID=UPI000D7E8FB3|nr:endolytic transglycosylase MltG [Streptosporangium sp. 'caverna']AWS47702.1 endolytic transglycosylase MltG [Streptosporangium sp. 'caverna']